jgi:hypothetical protein
MGVAVAVPNFSIEGEEWFRARDAAADEERVRVSAQ